MQKKIHTYEGEEITVTYDVKRCIHARECVGNLPKVFSPKNRPWVQPDEESADKVADTIEKCPTGALQYTVKDGSRKEKPSSKNRIILAKDGPVYLFGDIEIQSADGRTVLEDTRIALCRCGASQNKPLCDDSHKKIDFEADAEADTSSHPAATDGEHGRIILKLMKNGPVLVEGTYTIETDAREPHTSDKNLALCRCGSSSNKPFCDGTHKEIGFKDSQQG